MTTYLPLSSPKPSLDELFQSVFHNVSYTRYLVPLTIPLPTPSPTSALLSLLSSSSSSNLFTGNDDPSSDVSSTVTKPSSSSSTLPPSSSIPTFLHITCLNNIFYMYYGTEHQQIFSSSYTFMQFEKLRIDNDFTNENDTTELFFTETIKAIQQDYSCTFQPVPHSPHQYLCRLVIRKDEHGEQSAEFILPLLTYNQSNPKNIGLTSLPFTSHDYLSSYPSSSSSSSSSLYSSTYPYVPSTTTILGGTGGSGPLTNSGTGLIVPLPSPIFTLFMSQSYEIYSLRQQLSQLGTFSSQSYAYPSSLLPSNTTLYPSLASNIIASQESGGTISSSQQTLLNSPGKRGRDIVLSHDDHDATKRFATTTNNGSNTVPFVSSTTVTTQSHPPPAPVLKKDLLNPQRPRPYTGSHR